MESVFRRVGSCGCFQICHVTCIQFIRMTHAWCMAFMTFGNYEPPWECVQRDVMPNLFMTNVTSRVGYGTNDTSTSMMDPRGFVTSSKRNSNSSNHNYTTQGTCDKLPLCDEVRFDPTSVTLVTDFGLICDQAYIPSLIIAIQMCGMTIGTITGGQIAELFGRKINIYSSLAIMSVSCLVAAWSTSWQMFAVLIFFLGFGEGGIVSSHLIYAVEFLTPVWRGRFTAIPLWECYMVLFAVIATCLKNWRHMALLIGALSTVVLLGALWIPESLRWLRLHEKDAQAKRVIGKMMKFNRCKGDVDDVYQTFKEIRVNEGTTKPRKYTYLDLFRTGRLRCLTIKSSIVNISVSMCTFTIGFSVKSLSGDFYLNLFLSTLMGLPFLAMMGLCINRLGRKFTLSFSICSATAFTMSCVIAYYVTESYEVSGPIITYLALLAKGLAGMGWLTSSLFSIELFPTAVRSLAVGVLASVDRVGAIIGTLLIPRDHQSLAVSFIVFSVSMLISFLIVLSFPETKGMPLEDELGTPSKEEEEQRELSCDT